MPSTTELRPGDPRGLGGYRLQGRLGEGGQGVVYLGADAQGTRAAVKWLRPHLAGDAVAAERFAREAAVSQRVAPFCTAKVLATGVHEGRPYIVSEYVDGPSLRQVVSREGPRAEGALHRLAIGTATALAAIHQAGIVHRDFSPGNVLLGGEGARVIDFGVARALDATSTITAAPVGTPAYMAPEQILGHPAGPAADVFAWAGTIVYAATGAGPFEAENVPAIIQRVLHAEPDLSGLAGPLRELVAECLSKDPARRPTAEQVIARLLQHPFGGPQPQPQPFQPVRPVRPAGYRRPGAPASPREKRAWMAGAIVSGVALATAIAIAVVVVVSLPIGAPARPTAAPTGTPPTPASTSTPVPTANLTTVKLAGTGATLYESPSDPIRLTTYLVKDSKTDDWVYYARDSLTGPFTKYPDMWESVLSPDGRYLVQRGKRYVDGYDTVRITDKTTGRRFSVRTTRRPLSAYVQTWSPDSTRILVNIGNPVQGVWQSTGFAIVDVAARKSTAVSLREGSLKGVRYGFDPTGAGVVALADDAGRQALRFFDAGGTRVRRIPGVGPGIAESLFSPTGKRFVTGCPGTDSGAHCVYDSATGAELRRIASACGGLATWYDEDHLVCWLRADATPGRRRLQVIDFTGAPVRLLVDAPPGITGFDVLYTHRR